MLTPTPDHPWYWYAGLVAVGVLVLAGIGWTRRVWREARGEVDDECPTTEDLFTPLAMAYKSGQMSEEEFRRIRDSLIPAPTDKLSPSPREKPRSQPAPEATGPVPTPPEPPRDDRPD
jgi:hypothetical protein